MKTPKRTYSTCFLEWGDEFSGRLSSGQQRAYARWHRKNRVKQLKHTIAKLSFENNIFKQTFIQNRAFLKRLKAICREPNRSPLHRLADIDRELQMELMATKDYERKEQA